MIRPEAMSSHGRESNYFEGFRRKLAGLRPASFGPDCNFLATILVADEHPRSPAAIIIYENAVLVGYVPKTVVGAKRQSLLEHGCICRAQAVRATSPSACASMQGLIPAGEFGCSREG